MNCINCGIEVSQEAKFCPKCGFAVEASAQPVESEVQPQADFLVNDTEPKKSLKKGKGPLWMGLSAVAVVLVVAIVLNLSAIGNFFKKAFSSDEEYFKHVMSKETDAFAESLAALFSTESTVSDVSAKGAIGFEFGDSLISLLEESSGSYDFDWLSKGEVELDFSMKDNKMGGQMVAKLNNTEIASMEMFYDLMEQIAFYRFPELNEQYLYLDLGDLAELSGSSSMEYSQYFEMLEEFASMLPDEETVANLLKKYFDVIYDNLGDVDKEDDTLIVDGISQKAAKYTVEIDDETVNDIMVAVLETAKEDETIEQIIENVVDGLGMSIAFGDVYEAFQEGVEDLLYALDEDVIQFQETIEFSIWVDGNGNIIGRQLEGDAFEIFGAEVREGNKFAADFSMFVQNAEVSFKGKGTVSGNKYTGEYVLEAMGFDLLEVKVEDLSTDNNLNGTIEISLASGISAILGNQLPNELNMLLDMKIRMEVHSTDKKAEGKISLLEEDDLLFAMHIASELTSGSNVQLPDKSDAADMTDEDEFLEWSSEFDLDKILSNLEKAGVPDDIFEPQTPDYDYDYDYGYDYDSEYPNNAIATPTPPPAYDYYY